MVESALTRTMQAMSGRVSWLLALGIFASPVLVIVGMLLFAIYGQEAVPTATVVATLPNPGGTFTAVVENVDNGMGFAQGPPHDEIHLLRRGEAVTDHGDKSQTSIFYSGNAGVAPQLHWTDDRHLSVSYAEIVDAPAVTRPGRGDVVVTYDKSKKRQ